jgi:putative effector of murein hydrolase
MSTLSVPARSLRTPLWLSIAALGGVAWNIFGAVQFANSVAATTESLMASGLTPEQAAVMTGYPAWMTLAFAIGVSGGLVGSVLLLFRRPLTQPVLAASLVAYVALWIGDAAHGVFAAMGVPQVVILTTVVAIAAALFALSRRPSARA